MRPLLIIAVCVVFVVLSSCSRSSDRVNHHTYPYVYMNDCTDWTSLHNSDHAEICLTGIVQDSRCPLHGVCIWQGVAVAAFKFTVNGHSHDLTLSPKYSPSGFPNQTTVAGYKIELIDLYPYPDNNHVPVPGELKAEVNIIKL